MAGGSTSHFSLSTGGDRLLASRRVPRSSGSGETPEVASPADDIPLIGATLMGDLLPPGRSSRGVDQTGGSDCAILSDSYQAESPPRPPASDLAEGEMSIRGEIPMVGAGELAECQVCAPTAPSEKLPSFLILSGSLHTAGATKFPAPLNVTADDSLRDAMARWDVLC